LVMRVLIACEFSGVVREAFRRRGHDAWSADLLPATDGSKFHFEGDATDLLGGGIVCTTHSNPFHWDLLIAHPPCTRLCNSGVRWLHERDLWDDMREACALFKAFLDAPIPRVAIENPVMHRHAREIIGRGPDFTVQPWQFGHGEVKRTCFWTKGLPPLRPTHIVDGREARVHKMSPGPDRWAKRSITYTGIAEAMAEQWGGDAIHGPLF
jgi:hypothetical protein